jgi:predicted ATP-dependent endonuclease of OLD family
MIITSIKIQNYRGIKDEQIIPLSSFSSIIGKNDSGKSIVLNAIASFLDIKSFQITNSDFNDESKSIKFEIEFTDDDLYRKIESKVKTKIKKYDGLDYFLNDIIQDNKICIKKEIKNVGKTFSSIELLVNDYEGDFSFLYEKMDEDLNQITSKYSIEIPVDGKGRNSKLEKIEYIKKYCESNNIKRKLIYIEDIYKIDSLLPAVELFVSDYGLEADTKFKTNSVSEIEDFFAIETASNESRLKKIELDIQREMNKEAESIKSYMSDYTSSLNKVQIQPTISWKDSIKSVDVSFQFDGDSKPIPMSHKGTGYRRLFMVARFRYLAEKNKGHDVIYLIEEPETFLHPSAQEDLLLSLLNLSLENQIIITTHSPVFVGHTDVNSVILCQKDDTSIYSSSNVFKSREEEFIVKVIEDIGIKPYYNLVDKFEKIVFVEGPGDANFIDSLSRGLFREKLKDNEKVLILPGGGTSIENFINIDYFKKSNRELYLILDSDKQNSKAKEEEQNKIIEKFKEGNKCFAYLLKKRCIENYYHPRTIERIYEIESGTLDFFGEGDDVKKIINDFKISYKEKNGKQLQFPTKNNMNIFNNMTEDEWNEVIENDLVAFIKKLHNFN